MSYVDGFVIAVPQQKLEDYRKLAEVAGKVWLEHGALEYKECVGDDLDVKAHGLLPFPEMTKLEKDEVVVFSFIVFKSREHRDAVNAKVMADERIAHACTPETSPFKMNRMAYGGFKTIVEY